MGGRRADLGTPNKGRRTTHDGQRLRRARARLPVPTARQTHCAARGVRQHGSRMKDHNRVLLVVLILFVWTAASVAAEVMDKEPSQAQNWLWSVAGGLVAMAAWRWRWWSGLTVSSIVLTGLLAVHSELQDPFVGPAIRSEAGEGYVTQFYLAAVVAVVLNGSGVYLGLRRRR